MGGDNEEGGRDAGANEGVPQIAADPIVFVHSSNVLEFTCAALGLSFRKGQPEAGHKPVFILCDLDSRAELVFTADYYHGIEETELILIVPLQDVYRLGAQVYDRETFKRILSAALTAYCAPPGEGEAPWADDWPWSKDFAWDIRFDPPEPVSEPANEEKIVAPEPQPQPVEAPSAAPLPSPVMRRRRLPIVKWLVMTVAALIGFSIVQVCVYRFVPVPITILMIDRLFAGDGLDHRWVGSDRISSNLKSAVIAAEDAKFCTHDGFDVDAIKKAEKYNATHKKKRGASTISQQTAKNVFLWPSRSWTRKGFEVWYTFLIEHLWPKDRIMEVYLNSVEWGPGVFGAEAASQYWFHHSAATLSPAEASKLAAILPDPRKWKAANSGRYVAKRSGSIRARARVVDNSGFDACAVD